MHQIVGWTWKGWGMDIKERIRKAQPTTRTVRVWLGADLDLVDEYEAARQALDDAQKPGDSLAAGKALRDAQQRVDDLRARLDEFAVDFKLRGLDDLRYARLIEAHPPRKDDKGNVLPADEDSLWNGETFPPALLRAATVEPELDDDDWLSLLGGVRELEDGSEEEVHGVLTSYQTAELVRMAFRLTRHPVDVPFSQAVSQPTLNSGRA